MLRAFVVRLSGWDAVVPLLGQAQAGEPVVGERPGAGSAWRGAAQASANHDAFLATACLGFAALLLAVFLMPRNKTGASSSPVPEAPPETGNYPTSLHLMNSHPTRHISGPR